jgi:hypothetical protein
LWTLSWNMYIYGEDIVVFTTWKTPMRINVTFLPYIFVTFSKDLLDIFILRVCSVFCWKYTIYF